MGLALDVERVRSSEVLERTCHSSPKLTEVPCHLALWRMPYFRDTNRRALSEAEAKDAAAHPAAQQRLP